MLSVLFVTSNDIHVSMANRIHDEGHIVKVFNIGQKTDNCRARRVTTLDGHEESADLIVFGTVLGTGQIAKAMANRGRVLFGSSMKSELGATDQDVFDALRNLLSYGKPPDDKDSFGLLVTMTSFKETWLDLQFVHLTSFRMLNGDYGPIIRPDGMGHITIPVTCDGAIGILWDLLKDALDDFVGFITVPLVFGKDGFMLGPVPDVFLTPFPSICELFPSRKIGESLFNIARGTVPALRPASAVATVKILNGGSSISINDQSEKHVWRESGCELVTAWGSSVRESIRRAYRTVSNILTTLDPIYRLDVGESTDYLNILHSWGWFNAVREKTRTNIKDDFVNGSRVSEDGTDRQDKAEVELPCS